jgi:23S rRNA (guanine2445-N2)-methyltransferase / 23S rRNA (guanine2069-N7)-methyltransferase
MAEEFDVQRDHVLLIRQSMARLDAGGLLLFSTNFRKFRLDQAALTGAEVTDISRTTIPMDFRRDPKAHYCFEIRFPE